MKAKVIRENGYYWSRSGEQYLWRQDDAAKRRAVYRGEVKPTFRFKLRRFLRRLIGEMNKPNCVVGGGVSGVTDAELRRLRIKPGEKVLVLGSGR